MVPNLAHSFPIPLALPTLMHHWDEAPVLLPARVVLRGKATVSHNRDKTTKHGECA